MEVARERGVDLTAHRSCVVASELLPAAGYIIVMDAYQREAIIRVHRVPGKRVVVLGDLDPTRITQRAIPDPVDQPIAAFRSSYDRIDRCVRVLASLWNQPTGDNPKS